MFAELLIQLSPLKMFFFGLVFFCASWMAAKKILIGAILGVTVGETTFDVVRGQVEAASTNPLVLQAASAAGMPIHNGSIMVALVANVLLALSMLCLAQAFKIYGRAKRADMEQHFRRLEVLGMSSGEYHRTGPR